LIGSVVSRANFSGANLRGAKLDNIKGYVDCLDIFLELVRRCPISSIGEHQWVAIGKLLLHRMCWNTMKNKLGESLIPVCVQIAGKGFPDYLTKYQGILDGSIVEESSCEDQEESS